jgi:SSS family solute:Na+ symporter
VFTYRSGLRGPALISFVKDILFLYIIFAVLQSIAMSWGGWNAVFRDAGLKFAATPSKTDGLTLAGVGTSGPGYYITLALGSALGLWLYPHAVTGVLAAKNRMTVKRSMSALPIYSFMLGIVALLGFAAITFQVAPVIVDGVADRNTIIPRLFDTLLPNWTAGLGFAAIGIGALVPAAVMSIAAANLFSRNIYREYLRPNASPKEEAMASKVASLFVKFGAVAFILFLNPQYSLDLQLIGTVIIVQTLPAVGFGLFTNWFHRYALIAGLLGGLASGLFMLWQIPNAATKHKHFGGNGWDLAHLGIDGGYTVFAGVPALLVNITILVAATVVLRLLRVRDGVDLTRDRDYVADEGDATVRRLDELVDGGSVQPTMNPTMTPRSSATRRPLPLARGHH